MNQSTYIYIDALAIKHNLDVIKKKSPSSQIIAMVKSNAYGCGFEKIIPAVQDQVYACGVNSVTEAQCLRKINPNLKCIVFQGIFSKDEIEILEELNLEPVIHQFQQLAWLKEHKLRKPINLWIKINTGMNRLGFKPEALNDVIELLNQIPNIKKPMGIMTHMACADDPLHPLNQVQFQRFHNLLKNTELDWIKSIANSSAILNFPDQHADAVRPGILIYGASPLSNQTGASLGLKPVMHFNSQIIGTFICKAGDTVGYEGTWQAAHDTRIGLVPVGYGDGYPRHIAENTPVWVGGQRVPIRGKISMNWLTIDLSESPNAKTGDRVELWGGNLPIETIAKAASTIAYELMCQVSHQIIRI